MEFSWFGFMIVFMIAGLLGSLITLGIIALSGTHEEKDCRKKNCQRQDDGYCAKCHSDYYG